MTPILQLLRSFFSRTTSPGQRGEDAAARYFKTQNYKILARNLRDTVGEIDLLALSPDGAFVVIVEVKAAFAESAGPPPELRVGKAKQRKLTALGMRLIQRYGLGGKALRFDVVGVTLHENRDPQVRHYPNAFESAW